MIYKNYSDPIRNDGESWEEYLAWLRDQLAEIYKEVLRAEAAYMAALKATSAAFDIYSGSNEDAVRRRIKYKAWLSCLSAEGHARKQRERIIRRFIKAEQGADYETFIKDVRRRAALDDILRGRWR